MKASLKTYKLTMENVRSLISLRPSSDHALTAEQKRKKGSIDLHERPAHDFDVRSPDWAMSGSDGYGACPRSDFSERTRIMSDFSSSHVQCP